MNRYWWISLLVLTACVAPRTASPPTDTVSGGVSEAERVVEEQVRAYNDHDLEAFLSYYSPHVRIYQYPDSLWVAGHDGMRELYGPIFEGSPALKATITERITHKDFVIDRELVTGFLGNPPLRAVAIYEVKNGEIVNVWLML